MRNKKTGKADSLFSSLTASNNNTTPETVNKLCPNCGPVKRLLYQTVKVPVYVPVPVFTYYQVPVLHHFPLNQVVRQIVPVAYQVPVEHRINRPVPLPEPVEQKIIIPQAVPYGVKVPIPVPVPYYNATMPSRPAGGAGGAVDSLEKEFDDILQNKKRDIKQVTFIDQDRIN